MKVELGMRKAELKMNWEGLEWGIGNAEKGLKAPYRKFLRISQGRPC